MPPSDEPTRKRDAKHEPFEAVIEIDGKKIQLGTYDGCTVAIEETFKGVIAGVATPFQVAAILNLLVEARETLAGKAAHEQVLRDLASQGLGVDAAGQVVPIRPPRALEGGPFRVKA